MSTLTTRTFGVSLEQSTRTLPSRVVSHTVSLGLTTLDFSASPGVQRRVQSSRGPYSSSPSIGPLRPCWIRLKYIHVDFALTTSIFAGTSPSLKWRWTESTCTTARSPASHGYFTSSWRSAERRVGQEC